MSGLFGDGGAKAAKAQMAAQEAANKREEERMKIQEKQLEEEKTIEAKRLQAAINARRRGGQRALLSAERMDAETGLPELKPMS
jgi:hypothetical protein